MDAINTLAEMDKNGILDEFTYLSAMDTEYILEIITSQDIDNTIDILDITIAVKCILRKKRFRRRLQERNEELLNFLGIDITNLSAIPKNPIDLPQFIVIRTNDSTICKMNKTLYAMSQLLYDQVITLMGNRPIVINLKEITFKRLSNLIKFIEICWPVSYFRQYVNIPDIYLNGLDDEDFKKSLGIIECIKDIDIFETYQLQLDAAYLGMKYVTEYIYHHNVIMISDGSTDNMEKMLNHSYKVPNNNT